MWLLFAFSGPVFWALSTHIDKYLVEKYFKYSSTGVLMIFTSLIGLLLLPFVRWFHPEVMALPPVAIGVMMASGMLYMGAMLFYLQALQSEEASVVAPMFQASALWGALLAYLILGETLTHTQLAGAAFIIAGAALVSITSFRFHHIKTRFVLLMLACTFVLALSSVIFKFFAVEGQFWDTTFWTYAGEALFGIVLLAWPGYLRQFVRLFQKNPGAVIGVNAANELINLGGSLGVRYALLFAPIAIVQAISSTTTLFVFFFGILITLMFPGFEIENISRKSLIQKGLAALLIAAGVLLINV